MNSGLSGSTRTLVPNPIFYKNQDREKEVFQSLTQTHRRSPLSGIKEQATVTPISLGIDDLLTIPSKDVQEDREGHTSDIPVIVPMVNTRENDSQIKSTPVAIITSRIFLRFDDEDVDGTDVKDSWEDEDEPPQPQQPVAKAPEEKALKKPIAKATEKKGKAVEVAKQQALDPVAEKLHQQRLVEEANYKSTTELFAKKGDDKTVDNFIPKSESDFLEYAELISHKLRAHEKSYHYIALLKAVIRLSVTSLKAADTKDIASSTTTIANEKLSRERNHKQKEDRWQEKAAPC
ncbi:hypothetical protein V6N11_054490 [Hibiscus sabdariffa]|uniref:Eukaryotic translation initiation factor 3 30 kDa subunit n=1 Tax=Hibiscus sabdariffa TaxID=183260 RepID=A0ABR2S424_9ROSI